MSSVGIFYMARHGLTRDDMPDNNRVTGWLEVPLNAEGRVNARSAARLLKSRGITSITASDLKRTAQTASIISDHVGIPVVYSDKLRSWNMGAIQGMMHEAAKPFLTFFQECPDVAPPAGEPFSRFYRRFKSAFMATASYVKKFPEARPLLVTHSQDLDIAYWFVDGQEPGEALEFGDGVPPGGVLEVRVDGDKISIRKVRL